MKHSLLATLTVLVVSWPLTAEAGPPLVCWPLDIGEAKSLPWGTGPFSRAEGYDPASVVKDTLALLDGETPVPVRMETLRRATIYVSGRFKGQKALALELLCRLQTRALNQVGKKKQSARPWFDVGYLAECYKQMGILPRRDKAFPGYEWVMLARTRGMRGPGVELALALMTFPQMGGDEKAHQAHLLKAALDSNDQTNPTHKTVRTMLASQFPDVLRLSKKKTKKKPLPKKANGNTNP